MLAVKNISKKFHGVAALADVSLELHPGKVNAIIGENGAGKSTLMKILAGVHTRYEGEIQLHGKTVRFRSTREAEQAGIAIIHQELNLVPQLSVAENIFLGRELVNDLGVLDTRTMRQQSARLLQDLNLQIDPRKKIAELKVGQQQLVEIAKALHSKAEVIIMDEPTSAISDKEVEQLYAIIRQLKSEGKTIVYISHKLKELFTIADLYVVLRDGQTVDAGRMDEVNQETLIHKMTGRNLSIQRRIASLEDKAELLHVEGISLRHPFLRSKQLLKDITFSVREGEILGIYGLMGAGRTELLECIFGLHPKNSSGTISVNGKLTRITSPAEAISAGIALVPEDRKQHGLILEHSIISNITIAILEKLEDWGLVLNSGKEKKLSADYISSLSIKTNTGKKAAKNLSGGNQQKIVLAKWLATRPRVLLLDEPTRGVDINAKADIYALMKRLAGEGMSIIIASSEIAELLAVSDNILVMAEGEITTSIPVTEATEEKLLSHAIQKN